MGGTATPDSRRHRSASCASASAMLSPCKPGKGATCKSDLFVSFHRSRICSQPDASMLAGAQLEICSRTQTRTNWLGALR